VLPGVGAFDTGMRHLDERGLREVLDRKAMQERCPTIGICLGMQLLTHGSEEGELAGLGWIEGEAKRLKVEGARRALPLPHMGWNTVDIVRPDGLYANMEGEVRFYFVHSYGVSCRAEEDVLSTTTYGDTFVSALRHDNIFGTQFHPEKSHRFGMQLLRNFMSAA
jgi:glutamine amidotransferase